MWCVVDGLQGLLLQVDGYDELFFCSNDYLGLVNYLQLIVVVVEVLQCYGVGVVVLFLVSGYSCVYEMLEVELVVFVCRFLVLVFGNGYMVNLGVVVVLVGKGDIVVVDCLVYVLLIDGVCLFGVSLKVFLYNDVSCLEQVFFCCSSVCKLVFIDVVFSMDGDLVLLVELVVVCVWYEVWLLVDDVYGLGVFGL